MYFKPEILTEVRKPLRCFNCWKFGHQSNSCHGISICRKCGESDHRSDLCSNISKCVNCKKKHESNDINCSVYQDHLRKISNIDFNWQPINNAIIIGHINICSLLNKVSYINFYLTEYKIDILSINETWLKCNVLSNELFFNNYKIFRLDRTTCARGGVIILIKNAYISHLENVIITNFIELIHINIDLPNRKTF